MPTKFGSTALPMNSHLDYKTWSGKMLRIAVALNVTIPNQLDYDDDYDDDVLILNLKY